MTNIKLLLTNRSLLAALSKGTIVSCTQVSRSKTKLGMHGPSGSCMFVILGCIYDVIVEIRT